MTPFLVDEIDLSKKILQTARNILNDLGFSSYRADLWDRIAIFIAILILAFLSYLLFSKLMTQLVHFIIKHTTTKWDSFLYKRHFFQRIFGLIPPLIVLILLPLAFSSSYSKILDILEKGIHIYLTVIGAKILISMLEASFDYYLWKREMATSPYKGVVEMMRIFIQVMTGLAIVGILMNLKLAAVLTGLSAFAAIIILIFKDTLLGFVAGLQLAQNKMVKIGDWITVPSTLANGTVADINILTVKVQNFDNTNVYVPAYTLISNSFQNWDGMQESGIRRISKSIIIDVTTIVRPTEEMLQGYFADSLVSQYITKDEFDKFKSEGTNRIPGMDTNLGVYRLWLGLFLQNHPNVTQQPYQIIRDTPSDGAGLPLQLMFFITTTEWTTYENIQSLIFEQAMGMLSHFGLRQFQFDGWVDTPENPVYKKMMEQTDPDKEVK